MIKAVLFDMDGVLVDSEDFISEAAIKMFEEYGIKPVPEDFKPFVGTGENRYIGGVTEKYNLRIDIAKAKARTYEIYGSLVKRKLTPLPGARAIGGWMWGGADNKKAILAYSPLQRGILTGKIKPGHSFNSGDSRPNTPYYQEPNFSRIASFIENIRPVAKSKNISLAQLVLNWTMHQPGITSVITGARNPQQVEDNAYAASVKLSPKEINMINQELDKIAIEK